MSKISNLALSSLTTKDSEKAAGVGTLKASDMSRKAQCDLCKLSYSTEKELLEHSLSLLHHTKLEDRKENSAHECTLCGETCPSLADYRKHIATESHQKKFLSLKGDDKRSNQGNDIRNTGHTPLNSHRSRSGPDSTDLSNRTPLFYRNDGQRKGIQIPHSRAFIQFGRKHKQDPVFRFDQVKGSDNKSSQMWSRSSWKDRDRYENHKWPRESFSDEECRTYAEVKNISRNKRLHAVQQERQSGSSLNDGYQNNSGYSRPWRWENSQDVMEKNHSYYNHDLNDISSMDFTSDCLPEEWDDVVEHERFRANSSVTSKNQLQQGPVSADIWKVKNIPDRKRPRNENNVHVFLAESGRSTDSSSDEHMPVRDIPRRHPTILSCLTAQRKTQAADTPSDLNMPSRMTSIDEASNNVLERAERLCRELREKREASEEKQLQEKQKTYQGKGNLLQKKQEHESRNKAVSDLDQKQHSYTKDQLKDRKAYHERPKGKNSDQDSNSSSTPQNKQNGLSPIVASENVVVGPGSSVLKAKVAGKTQDGNKKSTEKNDVKNQVKSLTNAKNLIRIWSKGPADEHNKKGRISEKKEVVVGITGKVLSKPQSKPHLSKDNLKKIVNTPYSRDERLQLAKMLQSREHQRTAVGSSRTGLQLEGLHDLVLSSKDTNFDIDQRCSSQPINLEDLPKGFHQQILDLLHEDNSSQSEKSKISPSKLLQETSVSQTDVIVLSDEEDQRDQKKITSKQSPGSSPYSISKARKIHKSRNIQNGGVSESVPIKSTVYPPVSQINHPGNLRPSSPVLKFSESWRIEALSTDSDIEVVSCSSEVEPDERKEAFQKEKPFHDPSVETSVKKVNFSTSVSDTEQRQSSRNEIRLHKSSGERNQNKLNSLNVMEKFPLLMSLPRTGRMSSHKDIETVVSDFSNGSVNQNASDKTYDTVPASADKIRNVSSPSPETKVVTFLQQPTYASSNEPLPNSSSTPHIASSLEAQTSYRPTLPPKNHLTDVKSLPQTSINLNTTSNYGSSALPSSSLMSTKSVQPSSDKTFRDEEISSLGDDADSSTASSMLLPGDKMNGTVTGEMPSQTMSRLLVLSEKEEDVKQEKMTIDLKLNRLHRLLEQAVVQINICTERISQLHEEERELSERRLLLLRGAASVKSRWRSDSSLGYDTVPLHESTPHNHYENAGVDHSSVPNLIPVTSRSSLLSASQGSAILTASASTHAPSLLTSPDRTETSQCPSLSRADWLAKFSSFLPHNPSPEITEQPLSLPGSYALEEQVHHSKSLLPLDATAVSANAPSGLSLDHPIPERDISSYRRAEDVEMRNEDAKNQELINKIPLKSEPSGHLSHSVTDNLREDTALYTNKSHKGDAVATSLTTAPAASLSERTIITAPLMYVGSFRGTDPAMKLIAPIVLNRSFHDHILSKSKTEMFQQHNQNPSHDLTKSERRLTADVPGSTIAEILCPSRPAIFQNVHECYGEDSDIGSVTSSTASASSLGEQISRYCRGNPGASLGAKDPFRGHELSVIMSDTNEQRSIDSQQEEDEENKTRSICLKEAEWNLGEKEGSSSKNSSSLKEKWQKIVKPCYVSLERLDTTLSTKNLYGSLGEEAVKSAEALHLLERDYEGRHQSSFVSGTGRRIKRRTKQERETKDFTVRRSYWVVSSSSSSSDEEEDDDENRSRTDGFNADLGITMSKLISNDQSDASHRQMKINLAASEWSDGVKENGLPSSKAVSTSTFMRVEHDSLKNLATSNSNKIMRHSHNLGPVFDIWVVRGQMYVGHVSGRVCVYNMSGLKEMATVKEYYLPYLQCMAIRDDDDLITLILGSGIDLVFCSSNEEDQSEYCLGSTVMCLLLLVPIVYAGLDTGEVCIFDTVRMAVRDRCMCSDRPIHCLASGQEGAVKLLCVSSQDGTIIVVNANQCLPIRILTGHTKTAFSIQVDGPLVFSGSGDRTVLIQNLHTGAVEHIFNDSKGLIKSVCFSRGYLFAGGMDKLVRCYDTRTHKLVQVYYGAGRGVITKILVHGNSLITGNISGSVDIVDIDIGARNECHVEGCGLNFGNQSHLFWHLQEDHSISGIGSS